MTRDHGRGHSLRRISCGFVAAALLATPALRPTGASAYTAGSFKHVGKPTAVGADDPRAMVAGDFNADGNSDVAVVDNQDSLGVLLSHPDGQLSPAATAVPLLDQRNVGQLAVGQFTNDHLPDLVASGFAANGATVVQVLQGDGAGGFAKAGEVTLGVPDFGAAGDGALAVGDLDGDGIEDAVSTNGALGDVQVLLGDGHGNLTATQTISDGNGEDVVGLEVADVNGDRHNDIAMLTNCVSGSECDAGSLVILLGDSHGGFAPAPHSPFDTKISGPVQLSATDVNGDGQPDFVVGGYSDASIMLNDGAGAFTVAPGSRLIAGRDGTLATGYDQAFHDVFIAHFDGSARLNVLLAAHSGRLTEVPGSPFSVPGNPAKIVGFPLLASGTIDGVPVLFTAAADTQSPTIVNVMADSLRYSATPPPNKNLPAPAAYALFNDPDGTPTTIRDYESSLIQGAGEIALSDGGPPEIRASYYRLTDTDLAQDLVNAAENGAQVQVLLDAGNRTTGCGGVPGCRNPSYLTLKQLNTVGGGSWLKTCDGIGPSHPNAPVGKGHGCVAQAGDHNKFMLVSQTYDPRTSDAALGLPGARISNVVVQTSSNNTGPQYKEALNNALVTVDQPAVYSDYLSYFQRLAASYAARRPASVKHFAATYGYRADTTTLATHNISTWSFPQARGHDPIRSALDYIRTSSSCANDTSHTAGPARNGVAVAMSHINGRTAVMQRLAQLRRSGCKVQVAYAAISVADQRILAHAGVGLHRVCLSGPRRHAAAEYLHSKYVLVAGNYRGLGANRRIVYTGSENLDKGALTRSDDRMERYVESASRSPVFDAYLTNFSHLVDLSQYSASSTATCTSD